MKKILTLLITLTLLCVSLCMAGSLENQTPDTTSPLTPPEINVEPSSLTLGMISGTGGSVSGELYISNTNTDPQAENLEWNIEILTMDSLITLTASPDSGSVAPGQTQTVMVTWHNDPPVTPGMYTADIIVHNNALPNGVSDITVPVILYCSDEFGGLEGSVTYGGFGLEGVLVTCGNFQTYTNEYGYFSFNDQAIPSGFYDVCFYFEGYLVYCFYDVYLNPGWVVYLIFDIPLYLPPPENLTVTNQGGVLCIDWDPPQPGGGSTQVDYVLDDGLYENSWAVDPGNDVWFGNLFPVMDTGEIVRFEVYGEENAVAGDMNVWIDVFDSDMSYVGSSNSFVIPPDEWITVPAPHIPFSGEFYAMIHWDSLSTSTNHIGFDENGPYSNSNLDWYYDGTNWQLFHDAASCTPGVFSIRATASVPNKKAQVTFTIPQSHQKPEMHKQFPSIPSSQNIFSEGGRTSKECKDNVSYITLTGKPKFSSKDLPDPIHYGYNLYELNKGFIAYIEGVHNTSFMDEIVAIGTEYTYWVTAVYDLGESGPSNTASATIPVGEDDILLNYDTALYDNFPNPVLKNTTFEFSLKEPSHVTLSVYNLKGQLVATLLDEELDASASHCIEWDGTANGNKLANGIYFYKLETNKKSFLKKMVLMR